MVYDFGNNYAKQVESIDFIFHHVVISFANIYLYYFT